MRRPVVLVSANDRVIDEVADNLGALGRRMRVITAHQLWSGLAPSGYRTLTSHCSVCIKERAAGLGGYGPLIVDQPRDRRPCDYLATLPACAAVHRRHEHYGRVRQGGPDSPDY